MKRSRFSQLLLLLLMTSGSGAVYANANSTLGFNGLPVS